MRRSLLLLALAATVVTAVTASAALLAVEGGTLQVFTFPVDLAPIAANVDIDPDTLNPDSEGNFVMAYVELPEPWHVAEIDLSTVKLTAEGPTDPVPAHSDPTEVGDYDGDGIPDLMVKFDRQAVLGLLEGRAGPVDLVVTGEIGDATFRGTCTVNVLGPPAATPIPTDVTDPTPTSDPEPSPTVEPAATLAADPTPTPTPTEADRPVPEVTATVTPIAQASGASDGDG